MEESTLEKIHDRNVENFINQYVRNTQDPNDEWNKLAQFNDNTLQNYNWTVKSGIIGGSIIGQTDTQYNVSQNIATTTFDSQTFNNASDLSWVKTILHESVHAYVLSVAYDESLTQAEKNALLGPNYLSAYINGGHTFIATQYLNSMADVLQEYAEFKGYYPYDNDIAKNREFYEDLAWGGLRERLQNGNSYLHRLKAEY